MTAPQPGAVTITRRIAPGRTYVTEARFITPEQLRAEHARALHEEWLRQERSERQSAIPPGGRPTAYHERRKEETA